jgi:serine/threonine protein kinase
VTMEPLRSGDPSRVGDYVLLSRLGAGGMGEVFLGRSPGGRPVAVKLIHPVYAADGDFRRRFKLEVEAARRVGGFHTAPVVDAEPDADRPWMATAYVAGPSLAEVLSDHGPLPAGTLRVLGAGLADALKAIHKEGLIHRDLKPSNILLAADGPRVIDFGIARAVDASGATARVGTPGFMSPELLTGQDLTPAGDVFALGLVLAHAAGVKPFGEGPMEALNYRIVHQDPDLTGLDHGLAEVVRACLAKDPADRPAPAALIDLLSDGDAPGPWLPTVVRTMVTRRQTLIADEPPVSGPSTPSGAPFDGGVVYQTIPWKEVGVGIISAPALVAAAAFLWFPNIFIHGSFTPNSFSPHTSWGSILFGALCGLGAVGYLYAIADDLNGRRLAITPSGLDITVGRKHGEFRWEDVAKATLVSGHLYVHPKPGTKPVASPLHISGIRPPGADGPGDGWALVCPADGFGVPRGIVEAALAHYAGQMWVATPDSAEGSAPGQAG